MRHHFTTIRMTILKTKDNIKCWWGFREIGTFLHHFWKYKWHSLFGKQPDKILKILNIKLPYDSAFLLLDIYPRNLKINVHTKSCTHILIASLFITANKWKQPKYSSIDEWIKKNLIYKYNGILLSHIKMKYQYMLKYI